jgi:transcriptional regulator with XRE-family HTH domain
VAGIRINLDIAQIEALAGRGLSQRQICDVIGISEATLCRRKKDTDSVANAIKKGRSKSHAVIANTLFELARSGNLGAIIWYQKTVCGISEDKALLDRIEALEATLNAKLIVDSDG